MLLDGQVAVVTGGAVGIGRGIAVALAQSGAHVASLDIDSVNNAETLTLVRAAGRDGLALDCDVADKVQVRRAIDAVIQQLGQIDILVNNAAVWENTSLLYGNYASQAAAYERALDICALGSYYCALAAVPAIARAGGGNIINVITEHIKEGHLITGLGAGSGYDSAKFVQWRQTETWAVEVKELGIRVNALCMGATATPMFDASHANLAEGFEMLTPEDVGQAVINVLGHGPGGPTGQSYLFGASGTPRAQSLQEVAAIARA